MPSFSPEEALFVFDLNASGVFLLDLSDHPCRNTHSNYIGGDASIDEAEGTEDGILAESFPTYNFQKLFPIPIKRPWLFMP